MPQRESDVRIHLRELPKMKVWEYNSRALPQIKCFENTTSQSCLKGNVVPIEPSQSVPGRNFVGCNLLRVLQEEMLFWWHGLRVTILILDFLLRVKFDFHSGSIFLFFVFNLDDDSGLNFYSLDDESGSRFIYIWLSVDDSRLRISSFFFFFFVKFEVKV